MIVSIHKERIKIFYLWQKFGKKGSDDNFFEEIKNLKTVWLYGRLNLISITFLMKFYR